MCSILYKGQKKVQIPAPWASGRTIETIHPVRDNYKFKETVSFPGARHLYLKFDPRCSSQYDYDKVSKCIVIVRTCTLCITCTCTCDNIIAKYDHFLFPMSKPDF